MAATRTKKVPFYITASLVVSIGGLINGYDTGSIGSLTTMPQFNATFGKLSPTLLGFTVSLIMLGGGVPAVFAGYLADRWGRLRTIEAGALLFSLGAVLQCSAYALPQFLIGRAVAGLGEGVYLSNMAVYICEIAPARHRGVLAGLPQFMAAVGVCLGYFTCYGTVKLAQTSSMAWRAPFVVMAMLGMGLAGSCLALPDSPRWLVMHGRRMDAVRSLAQLDFTQEEAQRDILTQDGGQQPSLSMWHSFSLLFKRGYRARTILALFVLGMVQLSGIDGVLYYAPTLFQQAGLQGSSASFFASGLSAILMTAVSIPAFLLADRWGRRTSAITGGLGLSGCMLLIGILYAANVVHPYGFARWVVIVAVFVFGLTYCSTWAIVGKIYASEIQPTNTRAAANCVAQGLNFIIEQFTNWLVAMITPILLDKSAYGAYFLFGGLALGTVAVLAAYMPETRGKSLESIQDAFRTSSAATAMPLSNLLSLSRLQGRLRRRGQRNQHGDVGGASASSTAAASSTVVDVSAVESGASVHSIAPSRL